MNTSIARIATGAALIALSSHGAVAGGDIPRFKGSYAANVEHVPAPAPIPEYEADYYFGFSLSHAFATRGTISTHGPLTGIQDGDDLDGVNSGGIQVGRYFGRGFRGELSFDFRNAQNIASVTSQDSFTLNWDPALGDGSTNTTTYYFDRRERLSLSYHTAMVKGYMDFDTGRGFTPYIGAGAGFVLYSLKRQQNDDVVTEQGGVDIITCSTSNDLDPTLYDNGTACIPDPDLELTDQSDSSTEVSWGYSLAAMAGISIDVADHVKADIGWQGTYTSGNASEVLGPLGLETEVEIEDRFDNEIRVGLRFDIE